MTESAISHHPVAALRPAFETELSGVVDRLLVLAGAEADAMGERVRATGQVALEAAQATLNEHMRRNDGLTESLLQSEIQVEELRVKLQAERERAKTATESLEAEQRAREKAEAANEEAQTIREQIVEAYESQLQSVTAKLGAARAESVGLQQQLEAAASERARLVNALRTVQQACAVADPQGNRADGRSQANEIADDDAATHDAGEPATPSHHDATPAATAEKADRHLKLVAPSDVPSMEAPPEVLEYFNELFEQIEAMYHIDERGHASVDVVERLCANLRYAREVFLQRAHSAGVPGAPLFDRRLSVKLDEVGATPLGRHLAIAAYELTEPAAASVRAEAS